MKAGLSAVVVLALVIPALLMWVPTASASWPSTTHVTFVEHGLPSSDAWQVTYTVSGYFNPPVVVNVAAGTTSFTKTLGVNTSYDVIAQDTSDSGVVFSGPSSFEVTSLNYTVNLYFNVSSYEQVNVLQRGLPNDVNWSGYISLGGTQFWSWNNNLSSYTFQLRPGTYEYFFDNVSHNNTLFIPAVQSGYFSVTNSSYQLIAAFVSQEGQTYAVGFFEHNLPAGATWNLTVDGITYQSVTTSLLVYLTSGAHQYGAASGSYIVNASTVIVTGNQSVNLSFVKYTPPSGFAALVGLIGLTVPEFMSVMVILIGGAIAVVVFRSRRDSEGKVSPATLALIPGVIVAAVFAGTGLSNYAPIVLFSLLFVAAILLDRHKQEG